MRFVGFSFRPRWPRALPGAALLVALAAPPAHALRPFDGTDAAVAEPQSLETELGPVGYVREADERQLVFPQVAINYGAGSGWEFNLSGRRILSMTEARPAPAPRYEDFELAVKRVIRRGVMQETKGPSLAAEAVLLLPTSEEKATGFSGALILSEHVRWIGVHLNAEIERTRAHETARFGGAILEIFDRSSIHPVVELTLEREGEATATKGLLVGGLWQPRERLVMDFGMRMSYAEQHDAEVRAGMTFGKHVPHGPRMP